MRQIKFDPRDYPNWTDEQKRWWDSWTERARTARDRLLASNKLPHEFQSKIWSDLKAWLLENFFNGKCAYCEINVSGGFFGEGEHFRPKSGVRVRRGGKLAAVVKPDGRFRAPAGRTHRPHGRETDRANSEGDSHQGSPELSAANTSSSRGST